MSDWILSDAELAELQALNEAHLPHVCTAWAPTLTTVPNSGGARETTWALRATFPCRVSARRGATLEQLLQGAPGVLQIYEVAAAAGTQVLATDRLQVTGTFTRSDGTPSAFTVWLAVQGGTPVVSDPVVTLVTCIPADEAVLVPTSVAVTLSRLTAVEDDDTLGVPLIVATAVVAPAGAPQPGETTPSGVYDTTDHAVATANATTGVLTLQGPGTVAVTYTPVDTAGIAHPEVMGTSALLAVAPAPVSTTVTLNGGTVPLSRFPGDPAPVLARTVNPVGASQAGVWSSSDPAVAAVDPATGVVTPTGAYGTATFTFTPTAHPAAAGTSPALTVAADLTYAATLFWDPVATPGHPAAVVAHRYPVRTQAADSNIFLPHAPGRWGYAPVYLTPGVNSANRQQQGTTAAVDDTATNLAHFPELGAMSQGPGVYVATESVVALDRLTWPSGANTTAWYQNIVPTTLSAARNTARTRQDVIFHVGAARTGQLGKKLRVQVQQQLSSIHSARVLAQREVTLTAADQYVVLRTPSTEGLANVFCNVRTHEDPAQRATDVDVAAQVNLGASLWGDTRHVPTAERPTHARYGLLHQWPTRNSWLNSDAPLTAAGASTAATTTPAPDDEMDGTRRMMVSATLPAGGELRGPQADFQRGTGNGTWQNEVLAVNNTGLPPNYVWVGLYADPVVAGKLEAYLIYPDASQTAPVALADYDTDALADPATGRRFYRARLAVNTAGQNAKLFTPVIRNASGAALGPVLVYRCFALSEQLNEGRTVGWHSCLTPPRSGATTPAISEQTYTTVDQPTYLTRAQGVIGVRVVLPFDLYDLATRGGKFDLWQAGILGSPANLGSAASCFQVSNGAGGYNVKVQVQSATNVLNDGSPNTGGGGMSFEFEITQAGVWPAWTPIDFAWKWTAYGAEALDPANQEFMVGVGGGATQWFRNGDLMPVGYKQHTVPLVVHGAQGTSGWEFSGPFCFGSDIDLTGQNGGFSQGWFLGKTAATRGQVEGLFARLSGTRTAIPTVRDAATLRVPPGTTKVVLIAGAAAQRLGTDAGGLSGLPVVGLDAAGDAVPGRRPAYATSNAAVVTVDSAGYVTPVAAGTATVTATVTNEAGGTVAAPLAVAVVDGLSFATRFQAADEADWWDRHGAIPPVPTFDASGMTVALGKDAYSGASRRGFVRAAAAGAEYEVAFDSYADCSLRVQEVDDANYLRIAIGSTGTLSVFRYVNATATQYVTSVATTLGASPGARTIRFTLTGAGGNVLNVWTAPASGVETKVVTDVSTGTGTDGRFGVATASAGTCRLTSMRAGPVGGLPALP